MDKKKDEILNAVRKRDCFKVKSDKDKSICPPMEALLYKWIADERQKGVCLSSAVIMKEAHRTYNEIHHENSLAICNLPKVDFKASRGWFYNFCKRRALVLRRVSTSGRDLPNNVLEQIENFFEKISEVIETHQYSKSQILNMDETAIYLDAPSNYTYSPIGVKRVKATTSGSEKTRLSAAFTGAADGTKLPIFVIVPRKTPLKEFQPISLTALHYSSSCSFDETTIILYIDRVVIPYKLSNGFTSLLLIIDSARCHTTSKVIEHCKKNDINLIIIPPRLTNLIQPADVAWFSTLKKAFRSLWSNWYIYEDKTYTAQQNMRSPGYVSAINWLNQIWNDFDDFSIKESFELCGISRHGTKADGRLDINCSKLHSVLKIMIEQSTIINDFIDMDIELEEASHLMDENDKSLIKDNNDDDDESNDQVVHQTNDENDANYDEVDDEEDTSQEPMTSHEIQLVNMLESLESDSQSDSMPTPNNLILSPNISTSNQSSNLVLTLNSALNVSNSQVSGASESLPRETELTENVERISPNLTKRRLDFEEDKENSEEPIEKKRRGRKKGSKNKKTIERENREKEQSLKDNRIKELRNALNELENLNKYK
ncbi:unnamed protein product [Brachionus calyciflorus]|uniref:HTH CENPB-type domain-containing protein n=1 Tax=Brachionus calyciflorus TaxID=104777 RepID=A0A814NLM6_9BILA|nr:unnamed protein product [Brachionus calyciflorus]